MNTVNHKCSVKLHCTALYRTIILYSTVQYNYIVQQCTALHSTTILNTQSTVQYYYIVQQCIALHSTTILNTQSTVQYNYVVQHCKVHLRFAELDCIAYSILYCTLYSLHCTKYCTVQSKLHSYQKSDITIKGNLFYLF